MGMEKGCLEQFLSSTFAQTPVAEGQDGKSETLGPEQDSNARRRAIPVLGEICTSAADCSAVVLDEVTVCTTLPIEAVLELLCAGGSGFI